MSGASGGVGFAIADGCEASDRQSVTEAAVNRLGLRIRGTIDQEPGHGGPVEASWPTWQDPRVPGPAFHPDRWRRAQPAGLEILAISHPSSLKNRPNSPDCIFEARCVVCAAMTSFIDQDHRGVVSRAAGEQTRCYVLDFSDIDRTQAAVVGG